MRTPQRGQPGKYRSDEARPARTGEQGGSGRPGPGGGPRDGRPSGPPRPGSRPGGPARRDGRPGPGHLVGPRPGGGPGGRPPRNAKPQLSLRGDPLYGRNAVLEALRAGKRSASRLFVADGLKPDDRLDEIAELAEAAGIPSETVPRPMLDDLTQGLNHQGVLLEVGDYRYTDLADIIDRPGTILVLDHLQDPQNFGTLLRASDAAGIAGVVIAADRSVSVTPAVVNASAGAVEHLMIAQVANIARALEKIEESGRWIVGLDSGDDSRDLFETDVPTPVALVVGAEGSGISAGIRRRCQLILNIPMLGKVESLNAATAGSIAIYDMLRRERAGGLTDDVELDFEGDLQW